MRRAVFLLLVCVATAAHAEQVCKPVTGRFEASPVPAGTGHCPATAPFCTAGRVWGGIQGSYQFVMTATYASALIGGVPSIVFFTGKSDVALKSDDHVLGTDTGTIDFQLGGFASLITFNDNGGQIRLRGELDLSKGSTSGDYSGIFCGQ